VRSISYSCAVAHASFCRLPVSAVVVLPRAGSFLAPTLTYDAVEKSTQEWIQTMVKLAAKAFKDLDTPRRVTVEIRSKIDGVRKHLPLIQVRQR